MIMNIAIEKMLSHVYEIEGLMLVTRRLGEENTPDVITNKIKRKVRELAEMCGVELTPAQQPVEAPKSTPEPVKEAEPTVHLPEEDYDADETWQHDNGEEFKEVFTLDYKEPEHEVPVADREPDDDITVEFIEAEDDAVPEPEDEMPVPPVPTEFPEPEEEPLRVDQKVQRHLSKDIRKAFSINDRFRFQRELFAGSANAMNTAIEHIEAMTSYGNAELYFFSQLNWDRDNEVVQDFMSIVRNHFQK